MIERFISGNECGIRTNVYVISNDKNEGILVDTSYKFEPLFDEITKKYQIKAILLTHSHIDHVDGLKLFRNTNIPVYMSKQSKEALSDSRASSYYIVGEDSPFKDNSLNIKVVEDNEMLNLIGYDVKFLLTPGHTNGSMTFVIDELRSIFSGDTLFRGTWGRTDLPTGGFKDIINSLCR